MIKDIQLASQHALRWIYGILTALDCTQDIFKNHTTRQDQISWDKSTYTSDNMFNVMMRQKKPHWDKMIFSVEWRLQNSSNQV